MSSLRTIISELNATQRVMPWELKVLMLVGIAVATTAWAAGP